MEVIEKDDVRARADRRTADASLSGKIYVGLLLVLAGVVWLLYNFGVVGPRLFDIVFSWQMLLVVLGGYLLSVGKYASGAILMLVGFVFLVTDLLGIYVSVSRVILPVLLIGIGVVFLLSVGRRR